MSNHSGERVGVCYYCKKPVGRISSVACDDCATRDNKDLDDGMEAMYGND